MRSRREGAATTVVLDDGEGYGGDCFGGTARIDYFEVFRLEDARLVPVEALGVFIH